MSTTEGDQYRLTFRLRTGDCPAQEVDGRIEDVGGLDRDGHQICEFVVETEDGYTIVRHDRPPEESCPCRAVAAAGAIPRLRPTPDGDGLELTTYVGGTEDAQAVAAALETESSGIELQDYARLGADDRDWHVRIDLGTMTEKRREALLAAIEAGYYESPRRTTIEELAAGLDLSGSAFGTRLRKAEAGLADQLRESL